MKRGELYLVKKPGGGDPKKQRVFVVVSRQGLLDTPYSTVICAPIYSSYHGLETQVLVGEEEGLKDQSAIHCDNLASIPRKVVRARFPPGRRSSSTTLWVSPWAYAEDICSAVNVEAGKPRVPRRT